MKIINIGGPINSGKTTVSKILAAGLPNCVFIEVDELMSDAEIATMPKFADRIQERLQRLYSAIERHITDGKLDYVIFAYPMYQNTFDSITKITKDGAKFIVITLSPDMEKCQTNRGARELTEWEMGRIAEMYDEGVSRFANSDLFIDNTNQTPEQTAQIILDYVKG